MYCCYQCLWTVLVVQLRWMMWMILKSHSSGHTRLPGLDHHNFRHIHGLNLRTTSMAKYLADIRARPRVYRLPASLSHSRQSHPPPGRYQHLARYHRSANSCRNRSQVPRRNPALPEQSPSYDDAYGSLSKLHWLRRLPRYPIRLRKKSRRTWEFFSACENLPTLDLTRPDILDTFYS